MANPKSDNEYLGTLSGHQVRWKHSNATEKVTITKPTSDSRKLTLLSVEINTTAAGAIVVTDSTAGMIANIAANAVPGSFLRPLPIAGNLIVDNGAGSDITIRYVLD